MTVNFIGMATAGSFGSLPTRYTEEIREQETHKNFALRDFFDLFNHRFVSLFYRAWEKYRLPVQYEAGDVRFFERVLSGVIGMGTDGLAGTDRRRGPRAAVAGGPAGDGARPRSRHSRACWRATSACRSRSSSSSPPGTRSKRGIRTAWGGELALWRGPLHRGGGLRWRSSSSACAWGRWTGIATSTFFPTAEGFHALVDLVRLAVTPELDFQTRLILRAEEVPALRLEHDAAARPVGSAGRHGSRAEEFQRDPDDAVLVPESRTFPPSAGAHLGASLDSMEGRP